MTRAADPVTPSLPRVRRPAVPPLRSGDNLDRAEFIRRYDAMPPDTRAELIEGIVYMPPPVTQDYHSGPHFDLVGLLGIYKFATPGIVGGNDGSVFLDLDNLPQPDTFLMIAPGLGGGATINEDGYVVGPPELVIEVANTSADYDLHQKLGVYRRNGVPEYGIWRTLDEAFDFFRLKAGRYRRSPASGDGLIRSRSLPGLWLNVVALLAGDMARAAADMHRGLALSEHAAFAADLQRRRSAG
jgi:Uma2 family endonuclease